jgi:SET domain-containing protein
LQGRTKSLQFGRSPVHAWGLFAEEDIPENEFVIEYVGEIIRRSLEDIREQVDHLFYLLSNPSIHPSIQYWIIDLII